MVGRESAPPAVPRRAGSPRGIPAAAIRAGDLASEQGRRDQPRRIRQGVAHAQAPTTALVHAAGDTASQAVATSGIDDPAELVGAVGGEQFRRLPMLVDDSHRPARERKAWVLGSADFPVSKI